MKLTLQLSCRAEMLQQVFNETVGPVLDDARDNAGYTVDYQPAIEVDDIVRLQLHVLNPRTWNAFSAEIESKAPDNFVIRHGSNTSHMSAAVLSQGLAVINHGILALRPTL